jgi:nucleotide-binding universal stress UspA family protein
MTGIVVGLDDSRDGLAALDWAVDEAVRRHEPLTVLSVVNELPLATPGFYAADAAGHVHDVRRSTGRWARRVTSESAGRTLDGPGVPVHVRVPSGHPAKLLVEASRDASMVVVGRGVGGIGRLLLGSVSTAVVHHAHCPVVVVPTGEPATHQEASL